MGSQSPTPPSGADGGVAGTTPAPSQDDAVASPKPTRHASQIMALVLGILFLVVAAFGALAIAVSRAVFDGMGLPKDYISAFQALLVAFVLLGIWLLELIGRVLVFFAVPGVAAITLFARVTRPRIVANSAIAAVWLALAAAHIVSSFSLITFESWTDLIGAIAYALWPLSLPVIYTVCIVFCGRGLPKRSGREEPRRPCPEPLPPASDGQSLDEGDETT